MSPPARTGPSKGIVFALVTLTVLCLACAGAVVFFYLELARVRSGADTSKSGNSATAEPMTSPTAMRSQPVPAMRHRPRPATDARPTDARPTPMADDPMADEPVTPDPRATPPGKPSAVRAVPRTGKPGAFEIELLTAPPGVGVIHANQLLGQTPIRLRAKSAKRYLIVLNKEGHKVKVIKPKFSRFVGLRHRVTLKSSTHLARMGKDGQTRLVVRCRTANIFRVFLNGRDTGRNCPTILKVSRGPNAPGIFLPDKDRVTFRKVKSIPQQSVKVEFSY